MDNSIDRIISDDESDDLHLALTFGTDERVDLREESRSRDKRGLIMYFPTRFASHLVFALALL
jgi:hypothetical protein